MVTDWAPEVLVVDGMALLFRAFHSMPALSNSAGHPTAAISGVVAMLHKVQGHFPQARIRMVFDAKGPTFRHQLWPAYKAQRPPMPDELARQIEPLHQLLTVMGFPPLCIPGVEADDVMATLAVQADACALPLAIVSPDKDLAQQVNDNTHCYNPVSEQILDAAVVEQKFGVPPKLISDYLALVGDAADNIPGVSGVGPKTAARWLQQYKGLSGLIRHADELKGKVGQTLRASLNELSLYHDLVCLKQDVSLPDGALHAIAKADTVALKALCDELELRRVWQLWQQQWAEKDQKQDAEEVSDRPKTDYRLVTDTASLQRMQSALIDCPVLAIDTETSGLDRQTRQALGISLAAEPGKAWYLPLQAPSGSSCLSLNSIKPVLHTLLADKKRVLVMHHMRFDLAVLQQLGLPVSTACFDTMLASYVLNSARGYHDLKRLATRLLGWDIEPYTDLLKRLAVDDFSQVDVHEALPYAAADADACLCLYHRFTMELEQQPALRKLLYEIEFPLAAVLERMETIGVGLDQQVLRTQYATAEQRLLGLQQSINDMAGGPLNPDSPKQLRAVLFDKLGLPVQKKTPKGLPSTGESVLKDLAAQHPLPAKIIAFRSLSKLISTYLAALPQAVSRIDGRLHTHYQQTVAVTGRLSSSQPNLQNIPIRTEDGRRIREAFVAPAGWRILSADYSQVELRIMAHLSADPGLVGAFRRDEDIHTATAAEVFGVPLAMVNRDQRRQAKAVNFGLIYGMSAFGLAQQLSLSRSEAQAIIDRYFARYPEVHIYMERIRVQAKEQGYVETVLGRRLYLPDIHSGSAQRRRYAERAAINAPMQGTAADLIKRAMIEVDRLLMMGDYATRMVMQVHDELVFEVPDAELEHIQPRLVQLMEQALPLSVPLRVEVGVGAHWGAAH